MATVSRLRDDDTEWGPTRLEWSLRAKRLQRERARERRSRHLAANVEVRERNERGRFVSSSKFEPCVPGSVWRTQDGRVGVYEAKTRECTVVSKNGGPVKFETVVSLPYISMLYGPLLAKAAT